ncbi:hypothetical protein GE061_014024 [Apolygus lucorum]|uniref:Uncharacterized protein n=1 Tax=Apolygus lucorum TaxID=248454 RepID=A0A6A4JN12_APOLU|nr:hypothetical protein GE061_014024 [Apolygus lucorum]
MKDQDEMAKSSHPKNKKTLMKENYCYEDTPMVIKNYMQKQFADIASIELEETITSLICGPRSKSMIDIAERLLEQLVELTGEKCTLQTPKNRTQDIMVFMADRAGVWLNEVVDESDVTLVDRREKQLRGIEEGGKGDAGDDQDEVDDDVEIIKKKKRPSGLSRPSQSGDGDNADKKAGGDKQAPPSSRTPKGKQSGEETGKEQAAAKGQSSGKQSPKSKSEGKGEGKGTTAGDASKKSATSQPKPKEAGGTREGSKQGSKAAGDSKAGSKSQQGAAAGAKGQQGGTGTGGRTSGKSSKAASKPAVTKSVDKGPSTASTTRPSTSKDQSKVPQDGVKKDMSDTGKNSRSSQVPSQRPRTASELRKEKTAEILTTHLSQLIQETDKKPTPRQEALQDVISKRLEEKVGPRDSATIDAIREASLLLATYIDKMTTNVEQEYGETTPATNIPPVAQRGKGPVFSVRKQPSNYFVRQIPHTEAKAKVNKSRGLPTPGAITLTEGAFKPNETKEWANWANEVANMADRWSKWIDTTVMDAIKAADKRKAAGATSVPSTNSWSDWKETAGAEALEWRRNKKLLDTQAKLFSEKAESSIRPKTAPTEDSKNQTKKKIP